MVVEICPQCNKVILDLEDKDTYGQHFCQCPVVIKDLCNPAFRELYCPVCREQIKAEARQECYEYIESCRSTGVTLSILKKEWGIV